MHALVRVCISQSPLGRAVYACTFQSVHASVRFRRRYAECFISYAVIAASLSPQLRFQKKNVYVNGHTSIYAYVYVYVYAYVYVHVHVYSV